MRKSTFTIDRIRIFPWITEYIDFYTFDSFNFSIQELDTKVHNGQVRECVTTVLREGSRVTLERKHTGVNVFLRGESSLSLVVVKAHI